MMISIVLHDSIENWLTMILSMKWSIVDIVVNVHSMQVQSTQTFVALNGDHKHMFQYR